MNLNKLGIHLKVKNFDISFKFYSDFGFKSIFAYGDKIFTSQFTHPTAAENYRGVTFEIGNALFEIAEGHVAVKPKVFQESIHSSKVSAMIDVDSLAEVREIAEKNNYEIAKPEVTYPWGTRELVIRDTDGFILVFREMVK